MLIGTDTETFPIHDGLLAPRIVCGSFCAAPDPAAARLYKAEEYVKWFIYYLQQGATLVGHNLPYDIACIAAYNPATLPLINTGLQRGQFKDTLFRERLQNISIGTLDYDPVRQRSNKGRYKLHNLVDNYFSVTMTGKSGEEDEWRLRYGELENTPLEQWPIEATEYARLDSYWPLMVCLAQENEAGDFSTEDRELRGFIGYQFASCRGVRTNGESIDKVEERITEHIDSVAPDLRAAGVLRDDGTENKTRLKELVEEAYARQGKPAPLTKKGNISTSRVNLTKSKDPLLMRRGEISADKSSLSRVIPALRKGVDQPLNPGYKPVKWTGRVSSVSPNTQNWNRDGGYRECIEARPGYLFANSDYSQAELTCLSEVTSHIVGFSRMADAINNGIDVHCRLASELVGLPPEAVTKKSHPKERQLAKMGNFGFGGGMVASTMLENFQKEAAKAKNPEVAELYWSQTEETCQMLRDAWLRTWPEMRHYLDYISDLCGRGKATIRQFVSGRVRGNCRFTQAANTLFQGLAADVMNRAMYLVWQACYCYIPPYQYTEDYLQELYFTDQPEKMLYGAYPTMIVHDEINLEAPEAYAKWQALALRKLMLRAADEHLSYCTMRAEPAVMKRWSKGAPELEIPTC